MTKIRHCWDGHLGQYMSQAMRKCLFVCLCWGLTSQSTIFQSCRDGATFSWVINQYFRGVKCFAQGHNTAAVGLEPPTSRSGVRHSTTEPPRSPMRKCVLCHMHTVRYQDRMIPLVYISEIVGFLLVSVAKLVSLCLAWSETPEDTFSHVVAHMYIWLVRKFAVTECIAWP